MIPFKLDEFLIEPSDNVNVHIADKIYKHHIIPMIPVRENLSYPVYPSQNSSYRSKAYELSRGRSGNSQHTFIKKGATDWTCKDFENNKDDLLEQMIKETKYTRFAVYRTFIHSDYKETENNTRQLFSSGSNSKWVFKKFIT